MKKILMLCVTMVAIMIMASCSKDNDELIVGKWQMTSREGCMTHGTNNEVGSGNINHSTNQIEYVNNLGWVFNAGGTGYSYEIIDGRENEMGQFKYTITNDSLNIFDIGWGLETLNRRKLRLSMRIEITDEDGNFLKYEYGYLNFKRQ